MTPHQQHIVDGLRQRAAAERNAYGVITALSRMLDDAADLIEIAYLATDVVDVDTGGRL